MVKVRCGIGRMNYRVDPGLYALGNPDERAPVLVTANYKMTFDKVRSALVGRDVWILVLDTKGVNVWCASGKGTFGTTELISRIEATRLGQIVSHRELILPQLAGPGVSAHLVRKMSGFKVIYGPILADDIPAFIEAGLQATPAMRLKTFTLRERAVLIPVELIQAFKAVLMILPLIFFVDSFWRSGSFWTNALNHGLYAVFAIIGGMLAGAVLTPLLLPWLPGRSFALKGLFPGFVLASILGVLQWNHLFSWPGIMEWLAWFILIPAISAFLAMNFTGCSTYTSLSGVRKEMRWALPIQIGAAIFGMSLWITSHILG
jgi:hypothetical protein